MAPFLDPTNQEQENHEAEQRCNDTGQLLVFVLRTECSSDS